MAKVVIECTVEQASAISEALEVYARLSIGQIEHVAEMVSFGRIPIGGRYSASGYMLEKLTATPREAEAVRDLCSQIKCFLGYSKDGSNGIGHPHVSLEAHRAWEMRKVIDKTLSEHRNPNPEFRGVNYDGLLLRYTNDPAPSAKISD
jgi:hypothetical protein